MNTEKLKLSHVKRVANEALAEVDWLQPRLDGEVELREFAETYHRLCDLLETVDFLSEWHGPVNVQFFQRFNEDRALARSIIRNAVTDGRSPEEMSGRFRVALAYLYHALWSMTGVIGALAPEPEEIETVERDLLVEAVHRERRFPGLDALAQDRPK